MTDHDLTTDPRELAKAARDRLPELVEQIEELTRKVDPIELVSHLTLIFQTQSRDVVADREESTKWQVRIEWLAWLIFSRGIVVPSDPQIIDARIIDPLEKLLDDYFGSVALTLLEPAPGLSTEQNELHSDIRLEALFVRGEGFQYQIERSAIELF